MPIHSLLKVLMGPPVMGPPLMAPPEYVAPVPPRREPGFLEGCLAALCCCCLLDDKIIIDESPAVTQSAASDDASSITHRRHTTASTESNNLQYENFNVASFSKKQLGELKACIAAELKQIRKLRHRLKSPSIPNQTHAQPPSKKSKKWSGKKRPLPENTNKKIQKPNPNLISSNANGNMNLMVIKACKDVLTKLREHKNEWIFNKPVDVAGMGLHDYYDIIKQPMDLGTVKSRLARNLYRSPLDFAGDVRLTFTNVLTYNPKGHTVLAMAEQLLSRFEELFRPVGEQIERPDEEDGEKWVFDAEEELEASDNNNPNSMQFAKRSERIYIDDKVSNHSEPLQGNHASSSNQPMVQSSIKAPPVKPMKQPKPKAKHLNKREMSLQEKHKLGIGLQNLPQEKMEEVVQIIRKKNKHFKQDGDEIEPDIETVDIETLWELDRLVTNWKKMVSKITRQALMGNYAKTNGLDNNNPNSMQFAKRSGRIYIEDKVSNHSEPLQGNHASSSNQPMVQSSMKAPPVKPVKRPKPKAKDPNKREMSLEEKHKLGIGLQSLPPEKMKQAVQIIKKRNEHLKQDEDDIELDIEAVDTETLWELDRLITNWKKMVSKIMRQD